MRKEELSKLIKVLTKECENNFAKHKLDGYTLAEITAIPFSSRTIYSRKVTDWGTDEDKDEMILYTENGWDCFDLTVQYGAGVKKVIEHYHNYITEEKLVEMLESLDLESKLEFYHNAYKVLDLSNCTWELNSK